VFAEPIGAAETIARYTASYRQLCEALEAKGLGAAARSSPLSSRQPHRGGPDRHGAAVRDVKRLTRLLCDKIETIDPGFGIELMRLAVLLVEPLAPKQMISSLTKNRRRMSPAYRYARQSSRGTTALSLSPVASDVPERSFRKSRRWRPIWRDLADLWPRPRAVAETEPIETLALLPTIRRHFTWRA